jgi:NTP pyrophosphatase (non-canonical NTP hydrolase)
MSEHFNGLTPQQAELLTLLAEECAEVIQAVTKIQRHGLNSRNPSTGEHNVAALNRELGQAQLAKNLLFRAGVVCMRSTLEAHDAKLEVIQKYLHHSKVGLNELGHIVIEART